MSTTGALIKAQLSADYKAALQHQFGEDLSCYAVSDIQSAGPLEIIRRLRKIRCDLLLLPVEDENSRCVLPVVILLGMLTASRQVAVVGPDLSRRDLSRGAMFDAAAALLAATISAAWNTLIAWIELSWLARAGPAGRIPAALRSVLYVNANLWFGVKAGGSVGHISGVINALLKKNVAVDFASCGTRLLAREESGYIPLEPPRAFGIPFELNYYRFSRQVARFLATMPRHGEYQAIYQRLSLGNYAGVMLARRLGVPLITEYNGSEAWVARNWGRPLRLHALACRAEETMLRHSDLVVTVSDVLAAELESRGIPRRRIVSYPNCIDPAMFDPSRYDETEVAKLRKRLRIAPDAVVATFIGTFGQWHGSDVLASAIAMLIRESAQWLEEHRAVFVLVGDGVKMPVVRRLLEDVGDDRFVRLVGLVPQAQAPGYLAASDVLLSPHVANADGSSFFGSPTKLFEYMAMGKAIVASRLDQIGEVLEGGVDAAQLPDGPPPPGTETVAVLCKPGDVEELARAIRFCVESPEWRGVLGANARRRALLRYTWSHHVDAILQGLQRLRVPG